MSVPIAHWEIKFFDQSDHFMSGTGAIFSIGVALGDELGASWFVAF